MRIISYLSDIHVIDVTMSQTSQNYGGSVDNRDFATTERITFIIWSMTLGAKLTTREIAQLLGITPKGAYMMLCRSSRAIPLVFENGRWYVQNAKVTD